VYGVLKLYLWGGISKNITKADLLHYNIYGMFKFSGMLALGLLIHNAIITIFKNNKNQANNARDLLIAYILTAGTYLIVGIIFFLGFPIAKSCISDNILNNLERYDVMTSLARLFLLFQMSTVFPLLAYLFRSTCYSFIFEGNIALEEDEELEQDPNAVYKKEDEAPLINDQPTDISNFLESSTEIETQDQSTESNPITTEVLFSRSQSAPVERRIDFDGNNGDEELLLPSSSGLEAQMNSSGPSSPDESTNQSQKNQKNVLLITQLNHIIILHLRDNILPKNR